MDRVAKAKLESLVAEIRSWPRGELRSDAAQLARRYQLDPMIVKRVAQEEGIDLEPARAPAPSSSTSATDFIRLEDVEKFSRERGK